MTKTLKPKKPSKLREYLKRIINIGSGKEESYKTISQLAEDIEKGVIKEGTIAVKRKYQDGSLPKYIVAGGSFELEDNGDVSIEGNVAAFDENLNISEYEFCTFPGINNLVDVLYFSKLRSDYDPTVKALTQKIKGEGKEEKGKEPKSRIRIIPNGS